MQQISFDSSEKRFLLQTMDCSYGLGISPTTGLPVHLHFGKHLDSPDELPSPDEVQNIPHIRESRRLHAFQEYPAFHSALYSESCLLALHSSGSRGTRLEFDSFQLRSEGNAETLELLLVDKLHQLFVSLVYTVYADSPLLDRRAVIRNGGTAPVTLQQAFSASLPLPWSDTPGRITHLHGYWAAEGQIAHTVLEAGKLVLESRTGLSGPFAMPFFAMDDGSATEESGDLLFGTLQWSGNWKIVVERNDNIDSVISGGINDFDFQWNLRPGAVFETPVFTFGFAEHGFGEMFRKIHRHIRTHIEPESTRGKVMPLICNTYGAFRSGEKMNAANTERAIQKAAALGAELFVFDAGWQETLGDWTAHRSKFHGTIRPQAELAHRLGMKFGVWAELESADRASSIFRNHREWFMQYPDQFPPDDELDDSASGRMLLNLTLPEVEEHLYRTLDSLICENELDYFKLDMNRLFTHPGSPVPLPESGQSFGTRYVQALYRIFERIRRKHPDLLLENCACGNFRSDWGFDRFAFRINRSDNQDGLDMLKLHEGFLCLHQTKAAGGGCHISDHYFFDFNQREVPRRFQAFAGMLGSLSIGVDLTRADPETMESLRRYGALYKKLRPTVQNGLYYRIASCYDHPYACYEFVAPDRSEAVVFFFAHGLQLQQRLPAFRLRGLDDQSRYTPTLYGALAGDGCTTTELPERLGRQLAVFGIDMQLHGDLDCRIVHLKRKDD